MIYMPPNGFDAYIMEMAEMPTDDWKNKLNGAECILTL